MYIVAVYSSKFERKNIKQKQKQGKIKFTSHQKSNYHTPIV